MKSTNNDLAQRERMSSVGEHQHSVTWKVRTGHCWGWHNLSSFPSPTVPAKPFGVSQLDGYLYFSLLHFFLNQPLADSDSIVNRAHNECRSTLPPAMLLSYLRNFCVLDAVKNSSSLSGYDKEPVLVLIMENL